MENERKTVADDKRRDSAEGPQQVPSSVLRNVTNAQGLLLKMQDHLSGLRNADG